MISEVIPNAGSADFLNLPERIKNILKLDKPDLIITLDIHNVDEPVISLEVTMTTPQSQHAKQRIPRIIAAAESDIPELVDEAEPTQEAMDKWMQEDEE